MHILMICASAPTRDRPRAHSFLAALDRAGHAVTLIFVDRAGTVFDGLSNCCERIVPVRRRSGLTMAVQAELAAAPYDLAHLDGPAAHLVRGPLPLPTVIDAGGCGVMRQERAARASVVLLRAALVAQAARARRCYAAARAHEARILVATPDDAWALQTLGVAAAGLYVVPGAVDLERFAPPAALRDQATVLLDLRGLSRAEAAGALAVARAAMARVWAQRADARLTVLGRAPFGLAGRLAGDARVQFSGATSDPRGHLARATLVLAPVMPAGGAAHAPLEAMATGAAVVGTPALADELGAAPGHELAVADGAAGWAAAILGLLDDPPYRGRLGRAGRRLIELRHGLGVVAPALEGVYAAASGSAIAEWRLAVGLGQPRRHEEG